MNPEIITRGLERDSKRHWVRTLWKKSQDRRGGSADSFADYIREVHPHMLPSDCRDLGEYIRCVLRGLYRDDL